VQFTPAAGFVGLTSFTYVVSDGRGGTDTGLVSIDVRNTAPVADDETYTLLAGQVLQVSAPGVLDGDTDADGDSLSVIGLDLAGLQGTVLVDANGALVFTPNAGFTGLTGFDYTVSDGVGGTDVGHVSIEVRPVPTTTVRIGDAPQRQTGTGGQWAAAWTHADVAIVHKADVQNVAEAWTPVTLHAVSPQTLAGGDIYLGDLGVSGQNMATSTVRQDIDGAEALRFNLQHTATSVTLDLSRFQRADDGGALSESARVRLFDAQGNVVGEQVFTASTTAGDQSISLQLASGFVAVELTAGAYNGADFVPGAYVNAAGVFAAAPANGHGSDFMVDWAEFTWPELTGVPAGG
jgi:hypothetical protein